MLIVPLLSLVLFSLNINWAGESFLLTSDVASEWNFRLKQGEELGTLTHDPQGLILQGIGHQPS